MTCGMPDNLKRHSSKNEKAWQTVMIPALKKEELCKAREKLEETNTKKEHVETFLIAVQVLCSRER